jgi:ABC-2 type transport system ATP-binding protein
MDEAEHYCDRIGLMHHGRLMETGAPQDLKARLGPGATLDEVFARIADAGSEMPGSYHEVGQTRESARTHG